LHFRENHTRCSNTHTKGTSEVAPTHLCKK
jgi:hypothetical protein